MGSLLAQIMSVSSLNGSVWHGRPVWNACEYFPSDVSGITNCLMLESAYSNMYVGKLDMITESLALNGASISGKLDIILPGFDLSPVSCSFNVTGNTQFNPSTEVTTITLSQASPCVLSSGNVNLTDYRSEMLKNSQSGSLSVEMSDAGSLDVVRIELVFEMTKYL